MSAPSLPLILFALADAIARGGMPEPDAVEVDNERGLSLKFSTEPPARRWAKRVGVDPTDPREWREQPYTNSTDGQQSRLINGYGRWHGAPARVNVLEPVTEPTAVAP